MRNPKTHAKVLAKRFRTLSKLYGYVPADRPARINQLDEQLRSAIERHEYGTGWFYSMYGEPHWQHHYTEIIPDTEEEA